MKTTLIVWSLLSLFSMKSSMTSAADVSPNPIWVEVKIGIIGTASVDILESAIRDAAGQNANGLLIRLDTPGGELEATRRMVEMILGEQSFPIVVWVGPAGARAGSAGSFITLAANFAAMAPGTNIGAAHPINASGGDIKQELGRKVTNDAVAFMESIANTRKRNVEVAKSFVLTSASITAEEALEQKIIDVVESDPMRLIASLHGRRFVTQGGSELEVRSQGPLLSSYEPTLRQKLLILLSNPNLFYLLFLAGVIGIGYELTHPGVLFPGVMGGICLILALIATSTLPISVGFGLLMLLGVALMIAEAFVPSFGILGIGGAIAFVVGSIFVVDPGNESGLRVSLGVIIPGTLTLIGIIVLLSWLVLKNMRRKPVSGQNDLIGVEAEVIQGFESHEGTVRIRGEIWHAVETSGVNPARGSRVRVVSADGMVLKVVAHSGLDPAHS